MPGCPRVAGAGGRLSHVAGCPRGRERMPGCSHVAGSGRQAVPHGGEWKAGAAPRAPAVSVPLGWPPATWQTAHHIPTRHGASLLGEHPQHHAGGAVTAPPPSLPLRPIPWGTHLQPWRGERGGSGEVLQDRPRKPHSLPPHFRQGGRGLPRAGWPPSRRRCSRAQPHRVGADPYTSHSYTRKDNSTKGKN